MDKDSLALALAGGALVASIFSQALPCLADLRSVDPDSDSHRQAQWYAIGGATLLTLGILAADTGAGFVVGGVTAAFALSHHSARVAGCQTSM